MRHFIVLAALLSLTACGGSVLPEEEQTPVTPEQTAPAQEASDEVQAQGPVLCGGADPACCAQYTDSNKCVMNSSGQCYWSVDRRCVRR